MRVRVCVCVCLHALVLMVCVGCVGVMCESGEKTCMIVILHFARDQETRASKFCYKITKLDWELAKN